MNVYRLSDPQRNALRVLGDLAEREPRYGPWASSGRGRPPAKTNSLDSLVDLGLAESRLRPGTLCIEYRISHLGTLALREIES